MNFRIKILSILEYILNVIKLQLINLQRTQKPIYVLQKVPINEILKL